MKVNGISTVGIAAEQFVFALDANATPREERGYSKCAAGTAPAFIAVTDRDFGRLTVANSTKLAATALRNSIAHRLYPRFSARRL
jgi:hypothetical protein